MVDRRTSVCLAHFGIVATVLVITCQVFPNIAFHYYSRAAYFILYVCIASATYRFSKLMFLDERIRPNKKAVLITGCDSGFGNQLARRLDSKGFHVFATCLFPDGPGATNLKEDCSERLQVLHMDVTNDESVQKALKFVEDNLRYNELWAVVNNAGIFKGFLTDFTPLEDYKDCMEVNFFGMVSVTKAFLPLLKKSKGRVVNITSLGGRMAIPTLGAYLVSKYASVAFTECLSQEMKVWGVDVISIEPELFQTPMFSEKTIVMLLDSSFSKASEADSYGDVYFQKLKKSYLFLLKKMAGSTKIVIDDLEAALTHKYPENSYKPRRNILSRVIFCIAINMPFEFYEKIAIFIGRMVGFPDQKDVQGLASIRHIAN